MPAKPETSVRKKRLAKTRALRAERLRRREEMLEDVVGGVDRMVIANKYEVSLRTVAREVDRALDQRHLATPARFLRLQVERINRALQVVDNALLHGDYEAVPHLVKLMDKLDRYQGFGFSPPPEPPRPPRLLSPVAPLAITAERTESDS